ncbi:MAG: adenylosuccinate lyase [Pantoea sp. Brub]|nr:adenylosuccinate lyase [Pantoea sp. Brub]
MKLSSLTAISPIDGRYNNRVRDLRNIFSEYALLKFRIKVEIDWLKKLANIEEIKEIPNFTPETIVVLDSIVDNFNEHDAQRIKNIESYTNHDIKAVEYFLKEKIKNIQNLNNISEFIHFACTSEDINNLSYALILKITRENIILPYWNQLINKLKHLAREYRDIPLLSRTHGQPASPSTIGKEIANFSYRMQRQICQLCNVEILGKFNGAVGNYNAHVAAYPNINWLQVSKEFVMSLGIIWNPYTTQIEPHDYIAEFFHCIIRFNTILIDLNKDLWSYISLNYFKQKITSNREIGSSTMPHKINPIDLENSEGNLGIGNAIMKHLSNKLPISRFQRDLTDSTLLRNLGMGISYSAIAYQASLKGINKLDINKASILNDLNDKWVLLAEPIQTVMRRYGIDNPYEKVQKLIQEHNINKSIIHNFIDTLNLPQEEKVRLKKITPKNYLGNAIKMVDYLK